MQCLHSDPVRPNHAAVGAAPRINVVVFGPGAVGGYLALCAAAGGCRVRVVATEAPDRRPALARAVLIDGTEVVPKDAIVPVGFLDVGPQVDVAIVAVKSAATAGVAESLARVLPPGALVVSCQNGLHNTERLTRALPNQVAAGIVAFNVKDEGELRRQTTRGKLYVSDVDHEALLPFVAALRRSGQPVVSSRRMPELMMGKLLLNLHNGVGAATGLGTLAALEDRDARRCYALCMTEGLEIARACGLEARNVLPVPLSVVATAMRLPNVAMSRLARLVAAASPEAKSSTLVDLERGRPTEIDELNGEIVRLAHGVGRSAPANGVVCEVVHELEGAPPGRFLTPKQLRSRVEAAVGHAAAR